MITSKPYTYIRFLAAAALTFSLTGCGKAPLPMAPPMGPMPVMVTTPEASSVQDFEEFTGRLAAVETVEIRPRVTGYLEKVHFQAGSQVKRGDVLFTIDPRWQAAEHKQALAATAHAKALLDNATREADRAKELVAAKAISTEEAETRRNALTAAQAALQVAEANQESTALDLEYTQVKSPISGTVSRENITVGNYVSGVAGFTTLLTTVVSKDPMHAYVSVPEGSYLRLQSLVASNKLADPKTGKIPVELKVTGEKGYQHRGVVESFDNQLDPTTGSIVLRATIPNPEGKLVVGAFCKLRIAVTEPYQALLVAEKLILSDQDKKYVLVAKDGFAKMAVLKLGATHEGKRTIPEGLQATDEIITTGLQMLREGMPVMKLPAGTPPPTAAQ